MIKHKIVIKRVFFTCYRIWSKLIMISAPRLPDDIDAQAAVEDLAPQMNKYVWPGLCPLQLVLLFRV